MKKITGCAWFTGRSMIGIVTTTNEVGEEKAYIGVIPGGVNYRSDCVGIAEYGNKFPLKEAKSIIKEQGEEVSIGFSN